MTTALIVDDSKLARIVMARALTALRPAWHRVEASDAESALALLANETIDLAFIDYHMAGKNGLALLADIRRTHPALPVAIVTANVQEDVAAGVRALNAMVVNKPVNVESIRSFVERPTGRSGN